MRPFFSSRTLSAPFLTLLAALPFATLAADDAHPGKVIYQKLCVECHGEDGRGAPPHFEEPLRGNRTVAWLAKRIDRTMPEDDEDACVGEDAEAVADYIYHAFYSPQARAGEELVKRDFSRLTVPQFQNSLTDIFAHFQWRPDRPETAEHGLAATYYGGGNFGRRNTDQKGAERNAINFSRLDPQISFNFGENSPEPKLYDAQEFSMRWEGSLIAEDTGTYEFVIKTNNGARLFLNNDSEAFIDGSVSSGTDVREETASIFLLGGRAYPVKIEFFKYKETHASIELLWKTPNGVMEVVPPHHLSPTRTREWFVTSASFPADDSSFGYARGTTVSRAWLDGIQHAANAAADYAFDQLDRLAGTNEKDEQRTEKLRAFSRRFASIAYRRPLDDTLAAQLIDPHFEKAGRPEVAVKRVIMEVITSPHFLYPDLSEASPPDAHTVASRLALALWDSLPDKDLLAQAEAGRLQDPDQVEKQARRMLDDPRSRHKLREFFHHWLELKDINSIAKDPDAFPDLDEAVLSDLRRSLEMFVDDIVWNGSSDYRELLRADHMILNNRLANFLGLPSVGEGFKRVALPDSRRAGVITHPYLLASFSYFRDTSPIHRGVFLTRSIVGRTLMPPPEAIDFDHARFDPDLTMREKVTEITRPTSCMGCHVDINPLGFTLESFDAVGRWREIDNKKPVDTTSDFINDDGETIQISTARDVAEFAISSDSSKRAFIRQLFHHTIKQPIAAFGHDRADHLFKRFDSSGYQVRQLLLETALVAATHEAFGETPKETASN
jgi:cytochrome c5